MKTLAYCFLPVFLFANNILAQSITQVVRGRTVDKETTGGISGAIICLTSNSLGRYSKTDTSGNFKMSDVPIGVYSLTVTFPGYKPFVLEDFSVISAKETVLNIELEETTIQLKEVTISNNEDTGAINNMTVGSMNAFRIEDAKKYPGTRDDPARMLSNFAGVGGADDTRNDVIIRGNSPLGFLWRFEGIDIPNPNHFAIEGSTGGSVNIINPKVLSNSDFMTGAYPAEYGNSLSGVLDLKMRNGNNEKHEFTASFGFLGTELAAEGPISISRGSSYIATYRYSTLKLFETLQIPIGTNAVPNYQDMSIKLNFPLKDGSTFSFFSIGGISAINTLVSTYKNPQDEIYVQQDRDQYFGSGMNATGISYLRPVSSSSYFKITLATTLSETHDHDNLVCRDSTFHVDSLVPKLGYRYLEVKNSLNFLFHKAVNRRFNIQTGALTSWYYFNMLDSNYNQVSYKFENRLNYKGSTYLIQPYIEGRYNATDQISFTGGLHGQFLTLNGNYALEPRAAIWWQLSSKQSICFSYGMHSQMQPTYIYFYHPAGKSNLPNKDIGFTRSNHYVLTYNFTPNRNTRLKIETYFQYLYDVPVDSFRSAFSMVNEGLERFYPNGLVNKGIAQNYGIEFTFEKHFSSSFFVLATLSLYNSSYKGSDGIERPTDFNRDYIFNLMMWKEFKFNDRKSLGVGLKFASSGGKRYTPLNVIQSQQQKENVFIDSQTNTLRFKPYYRTDLKIKYKVNTRRLTHEVGIDCVNILNTKNILSVTYSPMQNGQLIEVYQLGVLPLFFYQLDF